MWLGFRKADDAVPDKVAQVSHEGQVYNVTHDGKGTVKRVSHLMAGTGPHAGKHVETTLYDPAKDPFPNPYAASAIAALGDILATDMLTQLPSGQDAEQAPLDRTHTLNGSASPEDNALPNEPANRVQKSLTLPAQLPQARAMDGSFTTKDQDSGLGYRDMQLTFNPADDAQKRDTRWPAALKFDCLPLGVI